MLLTQLDRREDALAEYAAAAALQPDEARHFYNMACLQRTLGELEAAEANFDRTVELNPADFEAYKLRSELRRQTGGNNHVAELEALLAAGISDPRGEIQVLFALAKELEDLEEYRRSFDCLERGADLRRRHMQYDVTRDIDTMAAIRATFTPDVVETAVAGSDNAEAIFVLGMPRTGTTLIERMLASHTDVFAAGELNNFAVELMRLVRPLAGDRQPAREEIVKLSAEVEFRSLGEAYIASTRPQTGHTPRFIDKLPLNYLYVGLIHMALPNARIVHVRRHPLDTCYAIYKQLFVDAYPFSYDLTELGRYFVAYHGLMEHWHSVLPGVIYTLDYERLVADADGEARSLLEYCGLDWQPDCLRFYENRTASTTASAAQIRQPVYQSSVGKWRHFRDGLAPLIEVLENAGIACDD
jgi:tetratricopeptide (TPR) repeat protein